MEAEAPKSTVIICDEGRLGGKDIAIPSTKYIQKFNHRDNPLRKTFNDACLGMGLHDDAIRNALYYFDSLHTIRDKMKKEFKMITALHRILKTQTTTKLVVTAMSKTPYWKTAESALHWLKEKLASADVFPESLIPSYFKPEKPKKLSTANIAFFSAYYIICDLPVTITHEGIMSAIGEYMGFKRKIKISSAIVACKYALKVYKNQQVDFDSTSNELANATKGMPEKAKRHIYSTFNSLPKAERKMKLLRAITHDIAQTQKNAECL